MPSILKDWVQELGLRHQGTLLTIIRGCDTAPKNDPSKLFTRCVRDVLLNAHCGDAAKAATFIERVPTGMVFDRFDAFRKNCDHYPHHYVMHMIHAIGIIGYKMPDQVMWLEDIDDDSSAVQMWLHFYRKLCKGLHMNPETEEQLDERLEADELTFASRD